MAARQARQHGHEVLIYNAEFHHQPQYLSSTRLLETFDNYLSGLEDDAHPIWQEARQVIADFEPEMVGVTARTVKLGSALKLARLAKAHRAAVPIVFGGRHPTIMTDAVLANPEVDFVVRGEGEATLVELVAALGDERRLEGILGLSYRGDDGAVAHNPPRPLLEDIDSLPFPARTALYDHDAYESEAMGNIFTARGCPFSYGYCSAHQIWTRRVRYRSLDNVLAEMRQVRDTYGTKQFTFWDDSFTANRERILELCRRLRRELPGIYWSCTTRFDLIDEELVVAMKAAGCNNIELGVESGSQPVLDFINKGVALEQIRAGARLLNQHGVYWSAFFMVGIPPRHAMTYWRRCASCAISSRAGRPTRCSRPIRGRRCSRRRAGWGWRRPTRTSAASATRARTTPSRRTSPPPRWRSCCG